MATLTIFMSRTIEEYSTILNNLASLQIAELPSAYAGAWRIVSKLSRFTIDFVPHSLKVMTRHQDLGFLIKMSL